MKTTYEQVLPNSRTISVVVSRYAQKGQSKQALSVS